jgi:hypothetical protein
VSPRFCENLSKPLKLLSLSHNDTEKSEKNSALGTSSTKASFMTLRYTLQTASVYPFPLRPKIPALLFLKLNA